MKLVFGKITVDEIKPSLKKGTEQAQLRQVVTRVYDAVKANNSLSDSFFTNEEIAGEGESYTESRMFWQLVKEGTTIEQVIAQVEKFPKARIRRILSSTPIMSEEMNNVLHNGLTEEALKDFCLANGLEEKESWDDECQTIFYEKVANRQLVKDSINQEVVLWNGEKQYKLYVLSLEGEEDIDNRKRAVVNAESIQLTDEVKQDVKEEAKA